jgi:hypothetical protein
MKKERLWQKSLKAALLTLLLFTAGGRPVFAWNSWGHMAVAYLAYQHLTDRTRERAAALLRLNPYYESWKKAAGPVKSQAELDMKVFMLSATWADALKGDSTYKADGDMGGFRPAGPNAAQNTGFNDKQLHMYWHFYDEPFSNDKTALPAVPSPNAETQMQAFRKVLSSDSADDLKSYDLTWIIHVVADIHQPLHAATRVSKVNPDGDAGGNLVKINCPNCPANLHSFWDGALGSTGDPRVLPDPARVIASVSHLPRADRKVSKNLNADAWIHESFELARKKVYEPLGKGEGPYVLNEDYRRATRALVAKQVELAGERLANLLNSELK